MEGVCRKENMQRKNQRNAGFVISGEERSGDAHWEKKIVIT